MPSRTKQPFTALLKNGSSAHFSSHPRGTRTEFRSSSVMGSRSSSRKSCERGIRGHPDQHTRETETRETWAQCVCARTRARERACARMRVSRTRYKQTRTSSIALGAPSARAGSACGRRFTGSRFVGARAGGGRASSLDASRSESRSPPSSLSSRSSADPALDERALSIALRDASLR